MKYFSITLVFIFLLLSYSCQKEKVDNFIAISGVIKNSKDSVLTIVSGKFNKKIKLTSDGNFSDTLVVNKAKIYRMFLNNSTRGYIFLKNGYKLILEGDANNFFYDFKYTGNGSQTNNLLVAQHLYSKTIGNPGQFLKLDSISFKNRIDKVSREIDSISNSYAKADTILLNITITNKERFIGVIEKMYYQNYDFQ